MFSSRSLQLQFYTQVYVSFRANFCLLCEARAYVLLDKLIDTYIDIITPPPFFLKKRLFFLYIELFWNLCQKSTYHIYVHLFLNSVVFTLIYISIFMPMPHCVNFWNFIVSFETRWCSPPVFFFGILLNYFRCFLIQILI